MKISLFRELPNPINVLDIDDSDREISIYNLKDCHATGHNLYYPNVLLKSSDQLVMPVLERTMSLQINTVYERSGMTFDCTERELTRTIDTPLFFFVYNTDNYYHFLYDSLPYLISFFRIKQDIPEMKLLIQYPNEQRNTFYQFVLEFFQLLNINQDDCVILDDHTKYSSVYISTSYTHDNDSNAPPRKEIFEFYQQMVRMVQTREPLPDARALPKKIYVSRRSWLHGDLSNIGTNYTSRRKLVNEDDLVAHLERQGFVEVFTETITTLDKIQLFSQAEIVVGAIGGGIANVVFSKPETKLIALVSPGFLEVNKRFKYCLERVASGQRDVTYHMDTEHTEKGEFKTFMRVKIKDQNIIGEIEKITGESLLISYTDGSNTGWNINNQYKQIEISMGDVSALDRGLNSPWRINNFSYIG